MLDFNLSEMAVVAIVALVVIGPKDLPKAMRVVGYWVGRARGVARQFRAGFDNMVREAELEEMEKKWAAENERIMREHPAVPSPADEPADQPPALVDDTQPALPFGEDPAPLMVEKPEVEPSPQPAPADTGKAPS